MTGVNLYPEGKDPGDEFPLKKGGGSMFCPKCRDEFREGFTHCKKCGVDLVETLPPEETGKNDKEKSKRLSDFLSQLLLFDVENWLKLGGIIYAIIGVLYKITELIRGFLSSFQHAEKPIILFTALGFLYNILGSLMEGLFYYALGVIIGLLKRGDNNAA